MDTSHAQPSTSTGDPGPSHSDSSPSELDAGPYDLDTREEQHTSADDLRAPFSGPPACATETEQSGQRVSLEPDPLEQEPIDDDRGEMIQLPNLQTTQGFLMR